ncbi:MAG: alpha-amylase family glycosyl hydrolase [Chloroflexota bacterium]|nr:alpha-amylase family glycosyl hydrolase [Chloroflexota bacterium]
MLLALLAIGVVLGISTSNVAACAEPCTIVDESSDPPEQLGPGYKFIVSANTEFGEGPMVELHYGTTYAKYDCEYLNGTSLPPGTTARFFCNTDQDIPEGTEVEYQYAICNYGTTDTNCHSYTGFIYDFTAPAPPEPPATSCEGAEVGDNNVYWVGLGHNSFDPMYRNPTGPVPTDTLTVNLKFRTCEDDVSEARVRIWNDVDNVQTIMTMTQVMTGTDPAIGTVDYWSVNVTIPTTPTILYYVFRATDGTNTAHYRAQEGNTYYGGSASTWGALGGWGEPTGNQADAEGNSFQLTVYDGNFDVPQWMQQGIVYQIFPDRFRDGNPANNPVAGRFFYSETGSLVRSGSTNWNTKICDPRNVDTPGCPGIFGQNFYGGDLQGITQKVNEGYFDNLGVNVLYLNPIFRSPSNHKYDTADFKVIDPDFGTLADFQALEAAAEAHGIKIMLDGVFNHTSSDSTYFDRYHRYDAAGNLTSPTGSGTNDSSGACEATTSSYRTWFYFPHFASPGRDGNPGTGPLALCAPPDPPGAPNTTYEAWYSYSSLPKLQANSPDVRKLIWSDGLNSVAPYWTQQGADGWRFDVGGDIDPGRTREEPPLSNNYWEGFRAAVRDPNVTGKSDVVMLGEEWGDTSPWLLGNEWDSTMNYRFRAALLSWLFTSCVDGTTGCVSDPRGEKFQENDSNDGSSSGPLGYLSPSQLDTRLRTIHEDYPPMALKAMMNLEGSHDTQRLRFLLKKANDDNDAAAAQRMKEWWLFAFTYPGAPTLYYGDEMGMNHDGVVADGTYQDDPYNRLPFAWNDTPGHYTADTTDLLPHSRKMSSIRLSSQALLDGDVQHGMIVSDTAKLYGFGRTNGTETALIALNRDSAAHSATFSGLNAAPYNLPDGTVLRDAMTAMTGTTGMTYTVTGGTVTATVSSNWGVVLLEANEIDTPASAVVSGTRSGSNVMLSWSPVVTDTQGGQELATSYQIYRGTVSNFTPDLGSKIGETSPPAFGSSDGKITFTDPNATNLAYYYIVRSCNGAGNCSDSQPVLVPAGGNTPTPTPTGTSTATTTIPTSTRTATAVASSTTTAVPSATSTATATACPIQFADVPANHTFYTFVRCLACRGIVSGYPCGGPGESCNGNDDPYYRPGANVTRGQLSKIIANSAGLDDTPAPGQQQFADVPPGSPFYEFVERLAQTGAIAGYPCGGPGVSEPCDSEGRPYFRPNNPATRGQISKIVSIAAGFEEDVPSGQQTFTDVDPDSPFWVYIERLAGRDIISGYGEASRCPETGAPCFRYNDLTTRGQMAKIAANAFFPNCQTPARR